MYLEKAESNCDDFVEDLWTNNMDQGIQVVGARDSFKLNAIYQVLEKLNPEPSEIFVLSPDIEQKQFWDLRNIPIAQDLDQIASVLRQLLKEYRKRQKPFRIFIGHHINCVIELDDLHDALTDRALSLDVEYDARELNNVVAELRDFGPRVGITVIACTKSQPHWNQCVYSGEAAIRFAEIVSLEVFEEIRNQAHPCCLTITNDVYLMSVTDHLAQFAQLSIAQIPESKRAIEL